MTSSCWKEKSAEELRKEERDAGEALEEMFAKSRPKNLREGLGVGVSNIVGGAIGGVGVAVLVPTVGLAMGLRNGGIIGGALGVTGGAVVGAIGAAGLIVGGTVSGVTQIVRGVIAVPQAVVAPLRGKWWNEANRQWTYTDLSKAQVPDNDDDLLSKLEAELDAGSRNKPGQVKETYYYDVLEVDPMAEQSVIKRRYYVLARKYHPDMAGADNKEAADKFKEVAEAYQVLSDPALRKKYDAEGKGALSGDKTSAVDDHRPDPSLLLAFLFGSDRFNDYIGRMATSTSAMLGDSPKLSLREARTLQERRCTRLAMKLAKKMEPWAVDMDYEFCITMWRSEAESLVTASYGWELVQAIGMAYEVAALQFLASIESGVGIPSISQWAEAHQAERKKSEAGSRTQIESLMATMDGMKIRVEYMEKISRAGTPEERAALEREMEAAAQNVMLKLVWTTTVVDITSTIHETAQMIFFDQSVESAIRKRRAEGVKELGRIFQNCPAPPTTAGGKDARELFEDAAVAATAETMKRQDEAAHNASYGSQ